MSYYVYILLSENDGSYYIGQTSNLTSRLEAHNSGKSKYTKNKLPWRIYAFKEVPSRSEAIKFERKLKNLHSKQKIIEFLERYNFEKL